MNAKNSRHYVYLGFILLLELLVLYSNPAAALEYKTGTVGGKRILLAQGLIEPGDTMKFINSFSDFGQIDELWLYSPGGNIPESLSLGRIVREKGIVTRIANGTFCLSACVHMFIGGVIRYVDPSGNVCVHMFTRFSPEKQYKGRISGLQLQNLEQISAYVTNESILYIQEMGVSQKLMGKMARTPNSAPVCLSRQELVDYNIVNTEVSTLR
ncbi:MAG: hypothetical protein U1F76_10860 [Candidatus Competibacteraceae bacterium]